MAAGHDVTAGAAAAAAQALAACRARGLMAVTAESCTGGLVAAALTARAGASDVVEGGFVTYSNALKIRLLGVRADVLERHGAVSEAVAVAMAAGAVARSGADLAVAVTGIAGPGGGSAEKPVGLVHFATAGTRGPIAAARHVFAGSRAEVRAAAVLTALGMLEDAAARLTGPEFGAGTQRV